MNFQLRPEPAAQTSQFDALSEADRARAVALCNDIADFGHEFDAAFTAKNLRAAQICTRRVLTHLTNFNAVVRGTDCEFPAAMFDDMAKLDQALNEGNWDKARQLVQSNTARYNDEAYFRQFRRIASRIGQWARQQKQAAPEPPQNTEAQEPMPVPGQPLSKAGAPTASWTSAVPATVKAPPGQHRVQLKPGVELEITAVARTQAGKTTWWKPDGRPMDNPPDTVIDASDPFSTGGRTNDFFALVFKLSRPADVMVIFGSMSLTRSRTSPATLTCGTHKAGCNTAVCRCWCMMIRSGSRRKELSVVSALP